MGKIAFINELLWAEARSIQGQRPEMPPLRSGWPFIPEHKSSGFSIRFYKFFNFLINIKKTKGGQNDKDEAGFFEDRRSNRHRRGGSFGGDEESSCPSQNI
jgi:hypothetical protein